MAKITLYFAKIKEFVLDMRRRNKKLFLLCLALCGIVVVSACMFFLQNKNTKKQQISSLSKVIVDDYSSGVENKIKALLLGLKSVSKADVFVMVESSPISNYLTEKEVVEVTGSAGSTITTTTTVVYQKDGSKTSPIIVSTTPPKIIGVLIVLNKINASTKVSIINAVACVLNIDASCISILQDS